MCPGPPAHPQFRRPHGGLFVGRDERNRPVAAQQGQNVRQFGGVTFLVENARASTLHGFGQVARISVELPQDT